MARFEISAVFFITEFDRDGKCEGSPSLLSHVHDFTCVVKGEPTLRHNLRTLHCNDNSDFKYI